MTKPQSLHQQPHFTLAAPTHLVFAVADPMAALKSLDRDRLPEASLASLPVFIQFSTPTSPEFVAVDGAPDLFGWVEACIEADKAALEANDLDHVGVTACLLNHAGRQICGWKSMKDAYQQWDAEDALPIDWTANPSWLAAVQKEDDANRFLSMMGVFASRGGDYWEDIDVSRCTANVWIERDSKVLTLRNEFFDLDVLTLRDGAVEDAIESGYLTPPRTPRPTDKDWVASLLNYANAIGADLWVALNDDEDNLSTAPSPFSPCSP